MLHNISPNHEPFFRWPLTSFKKVFCVSSSNRINSFITITSPVSWCVTCVNSNRWITTPIKVNELTRKSVITERNKVKVRKNSTAVPWQPVQRNPFPALPLGWGLKVWRYDGSDLQNPHEETLSEPFLSCELKVTVPQATEGTYLCYSCAWGGKERLRWWKRVN